MHSGGTGGKMDGDDFCEFIMSYFSPTAFNGFGVDRRGFYSVYTEAFEEILKREKYFDLHRQSFFVTLLSQLNLFQCYQQRYDLLPASKNP